MLLGVCADPVHGPALARAGFDFLELHVQNHLRTMEAEPAAFEPALAAIRSAGLPCLAANCFLPSSLKVTGPDVDWASLSAYVRRAFERAQRAGIRTIVFGSGGARRIPDGFDRDRAWAQLVRFGRMIGPLAADHDVLVAVEPLNRSLGACNILTSVEESARYVREVGHPAVRLLVDAYHWTLDGDSVEAIIGAADLIRHVHVATVAHRLPPGFEPCDFSAFFEALRVGGYDGPISIEAQWEDVVVQAEEALHHLRALVGGAASN